MHQGGTGAVAYADGLAVYLGFLVSQVANHSSSVCGWNSANAQMRSVFARQAIPMVWDYAESKPHRPTHTFERIAPKSRPRTGRARYWPRHPALPAKVPDLEVVNPEDRSPSPG